MDKVDSKAEKTGGKFGKFAKVVGGGALAIGAATAAAGASLYGMATSSAETTDRIDKLSQKIGMSRQGFQEWDFIMSQSGGSVEGLQMGFKTLVNQVDQAVEGTGKGAEAFKKLGVSVKDTNGKVKDQETIFEESVRALQNMEEGTEKAKLANELFGRSGSEMMPLLNGAAGSVEEMKKQAHELGLVMSDDAVDAGVAFTDTIDQLERSFKTAVAQIGVEAMPVITAFADFIIDSMPTIQAVMRGFMKGAQVVFETVSNIVSAAVDVFKFFYQAIKDSLDNAKGMIMDIFLPVIESLWQSIQNLWDRVGPILDRLKEAFHTLQPVLETIAMVVGGIFVAAWGLSISILGAVIDALGPLIDAFAYLVEFIGYAVGVIVSLFKGDFAGAFDFLILAAESAVGFFVSLFDTVVTYVSSFVKRIIDFFHNLYMTLVGNSIVPDMVNAIVQWFKNLGKWAIDLVKNMVSKVVNWFANMKDNSLAKMSELWNRTKSIFTGIKNAIMNPVKEAKDKVVNFVTNMYSDATDRFDKFKNAAKEKMDQARDFIVKPIEKARDLVGDAVDKIKGFFSNMKLKFPKIEMPKLPRFSLEGEFSLMPPSVPRIGVDWFAKGGVMTKPTAFGMNGMNIMAGGEAGPEAILPLNNNVLGTIGKMIAETMGYEKKDVTVVNHYHQPVESASELARKQKQELRNMALEW